LSSPSPNSSYTKRAIRARTRKINSPRLSIIGTEGNEIGSGSMGTTPTVTATGSTARGSLGGGEGIELEGLRTVL